MNESTYVWPRIRDLPKEQQEPFRYFLRGQTCPLIEGVPMEGEEQDAYYQCDYERFRAGLPVDD